MESPHTDGTRIDIGYGVEIEYTTWRQHNPVGLIEWHRCEGGKCGGEDCGGSILFDLPGVAEAFPGRPLWEIGQLEPLTISPSLLCACQGCRHHGYIVGGRWFPC